MALAPIQMHLVRPERFPHRVRRIRNQRAPIHGDPPLRADKTSASFAADGFTGIRLAVHNHPAGILVRGTSVLDPKFHRPGVIRASRPLNDVVVVLAPIEFADVKAVRARVAVVREPRGRPQVKVPIQSLRHGLGRSETPRPESP